MNVKRAMVGILLVAFALAVSPAGAANCDNDTRRTIGPMEYGTGVRTYLVNKTSNTTVVGRVYRNGNQKDQALLAPGQSMVQVATTAAMEDVSVDMKIVFGVNDDPNLDDSGRDTRTQADCTFQFKYFHEEGKSRISKVSCPDMGVLCKGCTVNCKREWNADKALWRMYFNLIEPSR